MNIYEKYMDEKIYFYRYIEDGNRRQRGFFDLMSAVKYCLQHVEGDPSIEDPIVVDTAGQPKFAPRTIK